uniref:Uncharacterized protein n=1 Tax=Leptospirillum ferrodiazotrophum TaxID=412449 RepID=C6I090_9BACT|nr:MAG: hypothetical protein UBAL3_95660001 [Leptospirillum ferrodiazotrophum]
MSKSAAHSKSFLNPFIMSQIHDSFCYPDNSRPNANKDYCPNKNIEPFWPESLQLCRDLFCLAVFGPYVQERGLVWQANKAENLQGKVLFRAKTLDSDNVFSVVCSVFLKWSAGKELEVIWASFVNDFNILGPFSTKILHGNGTGLDNIRNATFQCNVVNEAVWKPIAEPCFRSEKLQRPPTGNRNNDRRNIAF